MMATKLGKASAVRINNVLQIQTFTQSFMSSTTKCLKVTSSFIQLRDQDNLCFNILPPSPPPSPSPVLLHPYLSSDSNLNLLIDLSISL